VEFKTLPAAQRECKGSGGSGAPPSLHYQRRCTVPAQVSMGPGPEASQKPAAEEPAAAEAPEETA